LISAVNLIDTSDAYGPEVSELLIAEALHPYPKDLVIATKGGLTRPGPNQWVPNGRPEYLKQCVDKSLQRLKLERIDLYQLPRNRSPRAGGRIARRALKEMQTAGKIRHVGLSEVSPDDNRTRTQDSSDRDACKINTTSPIANGNRLSRTARRSASLSCPGLPLVAVAD